MTIENTGKGLRDTVLLLALLALIAFVTACGMSKEENQQNDYFKQTGQTEIYK